MLVEIYSKHGCHLCDEAISVVVRARRAVPFELSVIDIESDPALKRRFGHDIPLVLIDGTPAFKYAVDEQLLIERLSRSP